MFKGSVSHQPSVTSVDPGVQYRSVRRAFGLDISDGSLKAVELMRTGQSLRLQAHSRLEIGPDVVVRGEIRQPDILRESIKRLLAEAQPRPITIRHVVLSLGEAHMYIHPFEFPETLSETQVRRAVPFEAEGELPITLQDAYSDLQFHAARDRAHHVLFAAAPRKVVDLYLEVLVGAGLVPVVIEVESLALNRCLVRPRELPVLLLGIGTRASTVTNIERGMMHGTITIPLGGAMLTQALAGALGVSLEEAEARKRAEGLRGPAPVRQALERALEPLVEEVRKAMAFHQTHAGRPVQALVLAGGTALLPGIVDYFAVQVGQGVEIGDPSANCPLHYSWQYSTQQQEQFHAEQILFTNSIGLALRGAMPESVTRGLNLLPPFIKRRYTDWWKHATVAALSVIEIFFLVGAVSVLAVWAIALREEYGTLSRQVRARRDALAATQFQSAARAAAEANAEASVLAQFDNRRTNVGQILAELRAVVPPSVQLASMVVTDPIDPARPLAITMEGVAARREGFLVFEQALRARSDVATVDSPIANLNQSVDAPFRVTLTFQASRDRGRK